MNEIVKENVLAKLLGNVDQTKLLRIGEDNHESIGNFSEVLQKAKDIHMSSIDYESSWADLSVCHNEENLFLKNRLTGNTHPFSPHGLSQYCNLVDVPTSYVKKMMEAKEFDLAVQNMNHWSERLPQAKNMLLRTTEDRLHGILSSKYTKFDDLEVLEATEGILGHYNNYAVKNYTVNPEYMKARIISRDKIDIRGEDLSFGFDIKNSRVGKSSLEISILIYRYICSNGVIFGGARGYMYTKRHVCIDREQFVGEFVDMLDQAPDTVEYIKAQVEKSQDLGLNAKDMQNLINRFKAENLSKNIAGRIESYINDQYQGNVVNLWDFTNAVTLLAQDYEVETREKMEQFAGRILLAKTA